MKTLILTALLLLSLAACAQIEQPDSCYDCSYIYEEVFVKFEASYPNGELLLDVVDSVGMYAIIPEMLKNSVIVEISENETCAVMLENRDFDQVFRAICKASNRGNFKQVNITIYEMP